MAPAETPVLTLAAAVAAADAIRDATGISTGIKWPNDLVIGGKKVCGILTEMSSESDHVNYIVIGIGINYDQREEDFPPDLRDRAVSLKTALDQLNKKSSGHILNETPEENCLAVAAGFSRLSIVRSVLRRLDSVLEYVQRDDQKTVLDLWRAQSATLGRRVAFKLKERDYNGTAVDITEDGRLLVDCDDGMRRELFSGEVSVRGIYGYAE
jgi:BirA family biotin operon repressor/biotin-[acetyl-CoA-carboxylase] ligase